MLLCSIDCTTKLIDFVRSNMSELMLHGLNNSELTWLTLTIVFVSVGTMAIKRNLVTRLKSLIDKGFTPFCHSVPKT